MRIGCYEDSKSSSPLTLSYFLCGGCLMCLTKLEDSASSPISFEAQGIAAENKK